MGGIRVQLRNTLSNFVPYPHVSLFLARMLQSTSSVHSGQNVESHLQHHPSCTAETALRSAQRRWPMWHASGGRHQPARRYSTAENIRRRGMCVDFMRCRGAMCGDVLATCVHGLRWCLTRTYHVRGISPMRARRTRTRTHTMCAHIASAYRIKNIIMYETRSQWAGAVLCIDVWFFQRLWNRHEHAHIAVLCTHCCTHTVPSGRVSFCV